MDNPQSVSPSLQPHPLPRRKISIAFLVILILASVATVLLGTLGALSYHSEKLDKREALRRGNSLLARQLSAGLTLPVWNFDLEQIEMVATSALNENDVQGVIVRLAGDRPTTFAAERTQDGIRKSYVSVFPAEGLIIDKHQIRHAGELIGGVEVCASPANMETALRRTLVTTASVILSLELLLILSLYLLLWRMVLRPLQEIERFAIEVSSSPASTPSPPPPPLSASSESLRASVPQSAR